MGVLNLFVFVYLAMTVIYNVTTINARLNDVVNNIDAGPSNGQMRFTDSSSNTVALIPLAKPSGTVAAGILTFSGLPLSGNVVLNSQITKADIEDSTGTVVASGLTVGNSSAFDIVIANPAVTTSNVISLTVATITGR